MNLEFLPAATLDRCIHGGKRGIASTGRRRCAGSILSRKEHSRVNWLKCRYFPMDAARALEHAVTAVEETHHRVQAVVNEGRGREAVTVKQVWRRPRVCLLPHGRQPRSPKRERIEGMFKTDRNGLKICFNYAKHGQCVEPCASGRAHCCQICLGPHTNVEVPRQSKG